MILELYYIVQMGRKVIDKLFFESVKHFSIKYSLYKVTLRNVYN